MTKLLLTIDTEHFTQAPGPVSLYPGGARCVAGGRPCGFPLIMDLCDEFGIKATFFINVFEQECFGEKNMVKMCDEILNKGHDIQLHTHPAFLTGRPLLNDHSLEEQRELLALGKQILHRWTGKDVVGHRAGYYAVNEDSIAALRDCGIFLDCSSFYGRKTCAIRWSKFELVEQKGVWELPVSWFVASSVAGAGRRTGPARRIVKVDIDKAGADCLIRFVQRAVEARYEYITYASHSFSFIEGRGSGRDYGFDERKASEFRRLLEFVSTADRVSTKTVRELWEDIRRNCVLTRPDGEEICLPEMKAH